MKEILSNLIEALREELKHYGEMLALLHQQQQFVVQWQIVELPDSAYSIRSQTGILAAARQERERCQRHLARLLAQPETSGFAVLIPRLPADYRPLVDALVRENNELLVRVQQRAQLNQLLFRRCVELMQQVINSVFPADSPATCDGAGLVPAAAVVPPLYQASAK
jgi:flagellar biosynthesis/type III secretory pathway chaperone